MCGLAGELRRDGAPDREALARMQAELAPRGPDGEGCGATGRVGLAHRRLAIIDLSPRGAQPMVDEALGLAVVFNGCIYNHRELRAELERAGHVFASTSDTEVLLKGWAAWGEGMLDRLAGMFAFALWERATGRLVLARDRLGVKPLYLADVDGAAALRLDAAGAARRRRRRHGRRPGRAAPLPLPARDRARRRGRSCAACASCRPRPSWWSSPTARGGSGAGGTRRSPRDPARADWSPREWEEALLAALTTAVERRMVADVPVGVLLSGGLDSSLIAALLAAEGSASLATFSIGFRDVGDREGDEFAFSDLMARELGTEHHQIRVGPHRLRRRAARGDPGDERADGLPRLRRLLPALARRSRRTARSCSPARAPTRCSAATTGTRRCSRRTGDGLGTYADAFFDRDDAGVAALVAPAHRAVAATRRAPRWRAWFARAGRRRRRSTARCGSTPS